MSPLRSTGDSSGVYSCITHSGPQGIYYKSGVFTKTSTRSQTPLMASTSLPDRFKLDTVFDGDTVVHKPRNVSDSEPSELEMIWHRDGKLGAGAYGVVWRERGEGSATGKLRAVKVISKQQINLWEVEALIELRGVSLTYTSSPRYC